MFGLFRRARDLKDPLSSAIFSKVQEYIGYSSYSYSNLTQAQYDIVREKQQRLREWIKTIPDKRQRSIYRTGLDIHIERMKEATRELRALAENHLYEPPKV
jgi:hypothetical protein